VRLPFRKSAEHGNDSRAQESERERGDGFARPPAW